MTVADLKKYKDNCYNALSRDLTEFEKNFLLIAGGILAFSTTFIKDIVKLSSLVGLPILFCAWTLIIIAIGLMMAAFLKSASASDNLLTTVNNFEIQNNFFRDVIVLTDEQCLEIKNTVSEILSSSKRQLKKLRYWAVANFLVGILVFATFVAYNLVHEKSTGSEKLNKLEITQGNRTIIITESK